MKKVFFLSFLLIPIFLKAADSVTVYLFLSEDCPICQYYTIELNELYQKYSEEFGFVGLFPNRSSTERKIADFKKKYNLLFPLKREYHQKTAKGFEVKVTPEVVVYDEDSHKILYQGRIDDTYAALGKRRLKPAHTELRDVLSSLASQQALSTPNTKAVGCYITYFD